MTDRELLEAAAKAAGIELRFLSGEIPFSDGPERIGEWNPLTDDGDALRLAVKLKLHVMQPVRPEDRGVLALWEGGPGVREAVREHNGDPYAATRRAIVRAAAAMAEGKA